MPYDSNAGGKAKTGAKEDVALHIAKRSGDNFSERDRRSNHGNNDQWFALKSSQPMEIMRMI